MKSALIIGRAEQVWTEVEAAKKLCTFDLVICINVSGRDYPEKFDHWVSFHPNFYERWIKEREALGHPGGFKLWAARHRQHNLGEQFGSFLPLEHHTCEGGSSGMLAVLVALERLDVTHAVLCGIPLENTPRYDDRQAWQEAMVYREEWQKYLPEFEGKVRSMSGWTKIVLGAPTKGWLSGVGD